MGRNEEGSRERSLDEALGPQPVSNLDPTYHTPTKTKHTCEVPAAIQDQAGEFHALEHIDVAWGSGDGGKAWGEMKKVPGKVLQTRPWGIADQAPYVHNNEAHL